MKIGSLVRIKQSTSQKLVGKLAIVTSISHWNATIYIIETGKARSYDRTRLEVINESR